MSDEAAGYYAENCERQQRRDGMHYFVGQGKKEAEKEECNRETESRKKAETRGGGKQAEPVAESAAKPVENRRRTL